MSDLAHRLSARGSLFFMPRYGPPLTHSGVTAMKLSSALSVATLFGLKADWCMNLTPVLCQFLLLNVNNFLRIDFSAILCSPVSRLSYFSKIVTPR